MNSGSVAGGQSPTLVSCYGFKQSPANLNNVNINASNTNITSGNVQNSNRSILKRVVSSTTDVSAGQALPGKISVLNPQTQNSAQNVNSINAGNNNPVVSLVQNQGVGENLSNVDLGNVMGPETEKMNKNFEIYNRVQFFTSYYGSLHQMNMHNMQPFELVPYFPLNPFFYNRQKCHTLSQYKQQVEKRAG